MLTDLRSILALAEEKGCAIPAFNCYTQECVMGVLEAAKETGASVTTEEANVLGGLGAAVAEYLSENYPVPVVRHGVNDEFGRSGKAPLVLDAYGVNADGIIAKVKQALAMKK